MVRELGGPWLTVIAVPCLCLTAAIACILLPLQCLVTLYSPVSNNRHGMIRPCAAPSIDYVSPPLECEHLPTFEPIEGWVMPGCAVSSGERAFVICMNSGCQCAIVPQCVPHVLTSGVHLIQEAASTTTCTSITSGSASVNKAKRQLPRRRSAFGPVTGCAVPT